MCIRHLVFAGSIWLAYFTPKGVCNTRINKAHTSQTL